MPNVNRHKDISILLGLLVLLLFASPLTDWLGTRGLPWYLPYLMWLSVVLLAALAFRRKPEDEP